MESIEPMDTAEARGASIQLCHLCSSTDELKMLNCFHLICIKCAASSTDSIICKVGWCGSSTVPTQLLPNVLADVVPACDLCHKFLHDANSSVFCTNCHNLQCPACFVGGCLGLHRHAVKKLSEFTESVSVASDCRSILANVKVARKDLEEQIREAKEAKQKLENSRGEIDEFLREKMQELRTLINQWSKGLTKSLTSELAERHKCLVDTEEDLRKTRQRMIYLESVLQEFGKSSSVFELLRVQPHLQALTDEYIKDSKKRYLGLDDCADVQVKAQSKQSLKAAIRHFIALDYTEYDLTATESSPPAEENKDRVKALADQNNLTGLMKREKS